MILRVFTSYLVPTLSAWWRSDGAWAKAGARDCSARTRLQSKTNALHYCRASNRDQRRLEALPSWSALVLFTLSAVAFAQTGGSISGRIEDATGSGIGAAKITVRNVETGASRIVTSDESGNYRALSLGIGANEVKVEKTGFKS